MIGAIVADDEDYWQVDDEARLAYAVGVAVDPTTPNAVNLLGPVLASYAEQHEQFQRGGREFDEPDSFDSVFWSQFFFPEPAWRGALDVALRSLKPEGTIRAPLMSDPVSTTADLRTSAGRTYALDRVVHGGWGVPARGVDDLEAELVEAGFVDTEFQDVGFARIVAARKPSRPTS